MTAKSKSQQGRASRQKGKRGEREVAKILREHGYSEAKRGVQYCGKTGAADVVGMPGYHLEIKFVERLNLNAAIEQSNSDAQEGEIPLVIHRQSKQKWKVTLDFETFLELINDAQ